MFKIGQTSGVGSASCCCGKPVDSIKDYLTKMAKCAEELPKCCCAKKGVLRVTTGTVSGCCGGSSSSESSDSDEASAESKGCCGGAAKTEENNRSCCCGGGCSGGTKTTTTTTTKTEGTDDDGNPIVKEETTTTEESSITDTIKSGIASVIDPITQAPKILASDPLSAVMDPTVLVPTTITDVLGSSLPDVAAAQQMSADEFRRTFCDNNPYPECAFCKMASSLNSINEADLVDLLNQIRNMISNLAAGNIGYVNSSIWCPGQISALLGDKLGPLGSIVGPCVASSLIGMNAVAGAVTSFSAIANVVRHTDLVGEVANAVTTLIGSGGITGSLVGVANNMLASLNIPTGTIFLGQPNDANTAFNASDARILDSLSMGVFSTDALIKTAVTSAALDFLWDNASSDSFWGQVALESAYSIEQSIPKYVAIPDPVDGWGTAYSATATPSRATIYASSGNPLVEAVNTVSDVLKVESPFQTTQSGVTYSYKNSDGDYVPIATKAGDSIPELRAQYGTIYKEEGATETPTTATNPEPTNTPVETYTSGKTYTVYDMSKDAYTEVTITSQAELDTAKETYGTVYVKTENDPIEDPYDQTTDEVTDPNKDYYKKVGDDYVPCADSEIYKVKEEVAVQSEFYVDEEQPYYFATDIYYVTYPEYYYRSAEGTIVLIPEVIDQATLDEAREEHVVYMKTEDITLKEYEEWKLKAKEVKDPDGNKVDPPALQLTTVIEDGKEITDGKITIGGVPTRIYEKYELPKALPQSEPLIFDDGTVFTKPVNIDARVVAAEVVNTETLVTKTHIAASEMAKLYGIGMTVPEIKMAYVLDHEENGSVVPYDVQWERVPTILDELVDEW